MRVAPSMKLDCLRAFAGGPNAAGAAQVSFQGVHPSAPVMLAPVNLQSPETRGGLTILKTVFVLCGLVTLTISENAAFGGVFVSERHDIRVTAIVEGLAHPWAFAFLPEDGGILITERPGRLRLWKGGVPQTIEGIPDVAAIGQGGMLDVAPHPNFVENRWVYLTHSAAYGGGFGTVVTRGTLSAEAPRLENLETLYRMPAPVDTGHHFGSRMAFDAEGYLFVSIGDRGHRHRAQDLTLAEGSLLRLNDDGSIPPDNPFVDHPGALHEIWTYGHRNAQGLFHDTESGVLWQHEHGPRGGDTLNAITRGANYGWPVATYGDEYGDASLIGDLPHERKDIENPFAYWVPTSIAPSGLTRYRGHVFPHWRGDLFLGALAQRHIRRVEVDAEGVLHEEEMLRGEFGRIRDVREGPDGLLYFVTDENPGALHRIEPAKKSWWFDQPSENGWRETGAVDTGGDIGPVYDGHWPWVFLPALGNHGWLWIAGDISSPEAITAFHANGADPHWIHLRSQAGWYYRFDNGEWHPLK